MIMLALVGLYSLSMTLELPLVRWTATAMLLKYDAYYRTRKVWQLSDYSTTLNGQKPTLH